MWDVHDPRSLDSGDRPSPGRGGSTGPDPRASERTDLRDVFARGLSLPRGREREHVSVHRESYSLRGSEVRTLATVGAFRVVPADDLREGSGRSGRLWHGDLDRLRAAGLIRSVTPFDRDSTAPRTSLITLTDRGQELLESHRSREYVPTQTFYCGLRKVRELRHDAQCFRAYLQAADRLERDGARLQRVVLDYELKREYQRWLQQRNRDRQDADGRPDRSRQEIHAWAAEHHLPVVDNRVQFPDVRIEFERPDGRRDVEDLEVWTEHYRGALAGAKERAGFTRYRASGARVGGRTSRGSRPRDSHLAEEFL